MSVIARVMPFAARPPLGARAIHDPAFEIRAGGVLVGVFLLGFVGWAAVARLDAAVHMPGVVRVAGDRQAVQSLAGGIVTELDVREGDHVREGQPLVGFATTETLAQERSLASRVIGLQAEIARIHADQAGGSTVSAPPEWLELQGAEREAAARALASEQANLVAQRGLLDAERAVLRQRLAEVGHQIGGYDERQFSNHQQSVLNEDELDGVQQLYKKGYATRTRVLALQRSAASIEGDIGATDAEIARLRSSEGETRLQIMQLVDQREHDNTDRLRAAQTELESLLPQWKAAREQLARTTARAPVSGTVFDLRTNTVGGVAAAGQKLMEIVPDARALEIAAQVSIVDAADLHVGQQTDVRFAGLRGQRLAPLHGTISRVSADSLTDEHSGRSFFAVTVSVPRSELDRLSHEAGIDGSARPGTPMEMAAPLKPRTALEYWLGPLLSRMRPAMSER